MDTRRLWIMWWSGLLAIVAFVHLLRSVLGLSVLIGTVAIPLWVSWVVFPLASGGSLWLARRARRARVQPAYRVSGAWGLGGCRPMSSEEEDYGRARTGFYRGIQASVRDVDEEDAE